ncbi:MAG: M48 family metallopeptidase, partial [Alphaproteobacteria bacterium]
TGVLAVALLAVGTIHYLPRLIAPLIPATWEKALGDRVVEDIATLFGQLKSGSGKTCDAASGRIVLDRLTARLTAKVKLPYHLNVLVLDIGIVNALATPGGNIVVFRELLTEAESPDEVAGIIAHEMGHVVARHPAQAVARDLGVSLIFNMLLGGFGGGAAGNIGQTMLTSAYSRDAEREADAIAARLLRDAGITTAGFVAFLDRLAKQAGSLEQAFSFISSHPPSAERAAATRAKTAQPSAAPALTDSEWNALRVICGD